MKKAFMRGVCALNMEAMNMFHEGSDSEQLFHGKISVQSHLTIAFLHHLQVLALKCRQPWESSQPSWNLCWHLHPYPASLKHPLSAVNPLGVLCPGSSQAKLQLGVLPLGRAS